MTSKPHSELPNDAETDALVKTITNSLVRLQGWLKPGTLKWSRDGLDALYVLERKYEYMTKTAQSYATERERLVEQFDALVAAVQQFHKTGNANDWHKVMFLAALEVSTPASEPKP